MLGWSIQAVWLGIGLPQGMLGQPRSTRSIVYKIELMDVSVAPPTLTILALGMSERIASGRLTGIQSPLSTTLLRFSMAARTLGRPLAYSTSSPSNAGTEFQTVTPCRRYCGHTAGSDRASSSGNTRAPPA